MALLLACLPPFVTLAQNDGPENKRAGRQALTRAQRQWLAKHPVIRLAPTPNYHPTEYFDDQGNYSGITSEFAKNSERTLDVLSLV